MNIVSDDIIFLIIKKLEGNNLLVFSLLTKKFRQIVNLSLNQKKIQINFSYSDLFLFNNYSLNHEIFYLNLSNNDNIADVKKFGNVHRRQGVESQARTLNLCSTKVIDVSMLGNVKKLIY